MRSIQKLIITTLTIGLPHCSLFAQAPNISYSVPPIYNVGTAITSLTPTNTGGAATNSGQTTMTLAGTGSPGWQNGPGNVATFDWPLSTVVDASGNVYVADSENHLIRKITPAGVVSTFAGSGNQGSANGTGTAASFYHPSCLAIDGSGNIYVTDQKNNRIRKITPAGVVTTFAGNGTAGSTNGTSGQPLTASFNNPTGLTFDSAGNLYVADYSNNKIRMVSPAGTVSDYAGSGTQGATNGAKATATFNKPMGVVVDGAGVMYITDRVNHMIRKVNGGTVSTLAGATTSGFVNGTGTAARFNSPNHIVADASGNLFVTDQANHQIRKVTSAGVVTTFAGLNTSAGFVNGTGSVVRFNSPFGLSLDNKGNIYVADYNNHSIRKMIRQAWAINPALPAGLTFSETTGVISGTPTVASPATTYTVTAYNATGTSTATVTITVNSANVSGPSADQNYIIAYEPLLGDISSETDLNTKKNNKDAVRTTIQYFDGLGRPLQTVQVKGTPDGTKDLITPVAYDAYGKEAVKYLPYAASGNLGSYRTNALNGTSGYTNSAQKTYYQQTGQGYKDMADPYAVTTFEPSPLNRIAGQGAPGAPWQPGTRTATGGRTVITEYLTNNQVVFSTSLTGNPGSQRVVNYYVDVSGNLTRGAGGSEYYASNELNVTTVKDENWETADGCFGTLEEYKDKEGRVILKRTYNKLTSTGEMLSTYYVYNDLGNLVFVLPPGSQADAAKPVNDFFYNFCYQYRYDERNRLVQKRIPGKGWEFIIYNKLDQVVLTQDAVQRNKAPQEWTVMKYDAFGRGIITGIYQDAGSTADANVNTPSLTRLNSLQGSVNNQTGTLWDKRGGSAYHGYLITSYPVTWQTSLQINYYDTYDNIPGLPATFITPGNASPKTKGLLTCTRTHVFGLTGNSSHLYAMNFYDDDERITTVYKQHYYGGGTSLSDYNYDVITNTYSFTGELTTSTRSHNIRNASNNDELLNLTVIDEYIYDHMGRKIKSWQTLTNTPRTLIAQNTYNEVGQLWKKYQHITDTVINNFKQQIDYAYNERGWLNRINDPSVTPTALKAFAMELYYHDGANKQFNGNIGNIDWRTKNPPGYGFSEAIQKYAYSYDKVNRLIKGQYNLGLADQDKFNEELTYDVMGNITTLKRKDTPSPTAFLNNIIYNYTASGTGNKLWNTVEGGTTYAYTYDLNGNMVTDQRNQITNIAYNLLNLPQTVTTSLGSMNYTYDASGQKLRKTGVGETREFIDGIEYSAGNIEFVATEEGRALYVPSSPYNYEYFLKDHLGNTRAAVKQDGSVIQRQDYYPFGKSIIGALVPSPNNKYKYNGKEEQETGHYDYGARFYDPVIARWISVDPLAEKMRRFTSYNYVWNNPLRFIDPDGMEGDDPWYIKLKKAVARFFGGAIEDTYESGYEYAANEADNAMHQGERYEQALREGRDPEEVKRQYKVRKVMATIKLLDAGFQWIGIATSGAEGSIAGVLERSSTKLIRGIDYTKLSKDEVKSIASNARNITEHQKKLQDYIKDPYKGDNKNVLKNAKNDAERIKIFKGRVKALEKEIRKFQDNIKKILKNAGVN